MARGVTSARSLDLKYYVLHVTVCTKSAEDQFSIGVDTTPSSPHPREPYVVVGTRTDLYGGGQQCSVLPQPPAPTQARNGWRLRADFRRLACPNKKGRKLSNE
jgi:hypothetical protein